MSGGMSQGMGGARTSALSASLASLHAALLSATVSAMAFATTMTRRLPPSMSLWRPRLRLPLHLWQRCEFDQLDAATLRDLGLDRSEYNSYLAEAHGAAERTRRRLGI